MVAAGPGQPRAISHISGVSANFTFLDPQSPSARARLQVGMLSAASGPDAVALARPGC